ncbi:hypothetical protein CVT24_001790 [Panaeolus cyanescens]|uniref:WLM domain-containing protein n=1 Tax=Panaeolus cyanescens TaxID=181874 RepID=A0A409YUA6_9AGAR|nr:hypothetical protein CVT24_001790 [Panaeolus cyanescens]
MTQTKDFDEKVDNTMGFPPGYFIVRSVANDRVLDVTGDDVEDDTPIGLWPEKEKSLVENFRDPEANNQVFFIDTSGALCSRSSGHAIDVKDNTLVLRHRRPVSHPFPNAYAHPLPKFSYSPQTGEITVTFACDPSFPPPIAQANQGWRQKTYVLSAIPKRKPRTIMDDASEFIATSIFTPISRLTGGSPPKPARPDVVFDGDIDLREDEIVEEEQGEEAEIDDSQDMGRDLRVVAVWIWAFWPKAKPKLADAPDSFLPENNLIGTMLHELTHNIHGPHDEEFYKYLDDLKEEFYDLQQSDYSSEGFFLEGHRLGTNTSHNLPPYLARVQALEAAEKRRKVSQVLGNGEKLGCCNLSLNPREMAVRAAEQRIQNKKACASRAFAQHEAKNAKLQNSQTVQNVQNVIDLTLDKDDLFLVYSVNSDDEIIIAKDVHPIPSKLQSSASAGPSKAKYNSIKQLSNSTPGLASSSIPTKQMDPPTLVKTTSKIPLQEWVCKVCTLVNKPHTFECDACGFHKPFDSSDGWSCLACGQTGISHDLWTCIFYGYMKLHS